MICLRMEKTLTAKTSSGDFQVITIETSLLSQQAVTSMVRKCFDNEPLKDITMERVRVKEFEKSLCEDCG